MCSEQNCYKTASMWLKFYFTHTDCTQYVEQMLTEIRQSVMHSNKCWKSKLHLSDEFTKTTSFGTSKFKIIILSWVDNVDRISFRTNAWM